MTFDTIDKRFTHSVLASIDRVRLMIAFFALLCCGLIFLFFRGLALNAGYWASISLTFLPIFVSFGILFSTGIFLIRMQKAMGKKERISLQGVLKNSWELLLGSAYISGPIILTYLVIWIMLGIFHFLSEIPGVGPLFSILLAFGPFLLNFAALALCVFAVLTLFFAAPILAEHGANSEKVVEVFRSRFQKNILATLLCFILAALPFYLLNQMLMCALYMSFLGTEASEMRLVLQWFFIMIPYAALLAPTVTYFFHLAYLTNE